MFARFRTRLIVTLVLLVGLTAGSVAALSYALVGDSLRDQLVEDALARAEFNVAILATPDQLPAGADLETFEASGLADRFTLRGTDGLYVEFADGDTFTSSLGLVPAGVDPSGELRRIVEVGEYGYEFQTLSGESTLIVGARRPAGGPDFYFLDSAEDVENALNELARVMAIAGAVVLVVVALGAGLIARRVLVPVAVAGRAAGVMAAGDLTVRLPTDGDDEFGALAKSFNRMANSLEQQVAALVEAHDREQRFVADVSHELRTPLTALVNEAALLSESLGGLSERDRHVGEMLVWDVARLRQLVEDLLEVSRLETSPTPPDRTRVDLVEFLGAVIAERHPATTLHADVSAMPVELDRRSLERIVGNLLDNARLHAPDADVRMTCRIENETLHIEVTDEGPGIPTDAASRVFDRFYKFDRSRQGGSGLGLAIARQHARRLGGDLTIDGKLSVGTSFELELPVTESLHGGDVPET